ncbi:uncharacterized protein N7477_000983 [Penicillium maclennaniae]|uniref:uncharacterized protein n=1 Tax=Penicillium maclennaniae TaxID=1343394 RepID=UPI0025407E15|nr:uncharacterized protein N7477_000983 [Penicillium maclennaniae]KAJ5684638.1 hypothetical protein N7477_000983 [Penicillium maclennaniae]
MATSDMNYEVEQEIVAFFEKTKTTRLACDDYTSVCTYIDYAGPNAEFVVQYRLKSLALNIDIVNLAKAYYET